MFYLILRALLKKQQRLQGKEVRFLTKKRQVFSDAIFVFFYVEQYPNRHFHQISFHIPLLVSKRAVIRHKIKRILIQSFESAFQSQPASGKRFKCFITLHKMKLKPLLELLDHKDDAQLQHFLQTTFIRSFTSFLSQSGKKQTPHQKS
ncbi:hypothetical protein D8B45_04455 [Candidatus Gracilibacteria bacterium]|nr:MAG: hypothetical protein D8B45_04455 [Candidatus Gracilibacteria bacterium]